jgi:hypothetical protein
MLRKTSAIIVLMAISVLGEAPVAARVAPITLGELAERAEFIGIVRVDRISWGVPLVLRPRAMATILDSWRGQAQGKVMFVAAPTWICDISDAENGEEAVVFVRDGSLLHAGRGRMPIFTRNARRLAAIWPDVRLPEGVTTEDGPEPEYPFIRAVGVIDLQNAVAKLSSAFRIRDEPAARPPAAPDGRAKTESGRVSRKR